MFKLKSLTILLVLLANFSFAQENKGQYIEFDDRKNILHGVYLGVGFDYGKIDSKNTIFARIKLAYVANKKFELGLAFVGFFSDQDHENILKPDNDFLIAGGYLGVHVEPILFGNRFINVSFPILIGGGGISQLLKDESGEFYYDEEESNSDTFFIVEPGVSILYNISRYLQLETGIKYRITSDYDLLPYRKSNINGFSIGAGLKIGVFNLRRHRRAAKNKFE